MPDRTIPTRPGAPPMDHELTPDDRLVLLEAKMAYALEVLNRILAKVNRHLQDCPECEDEGDALAHLRSAS